jgi:hypothetical protein
MVRYWYACTPLVIVAALFLLALPWLGLIALLVAALAALAALGWATVSVSRLLGRSVSLRWHTWRPASPPSAATQHGYRHAYSYVASQMVRDPAPHLGPSTDASARFHEDQVS